MEILEGPPKTAQHVEVRRVRVEHDLRDCKAMLTIERSTPDEHRQLFRHVQVMNVGPEGLRSRPGLVVAPLLPELKD